MTDVAAAPTAPAVPVDLERSLAELGIIVAAAADSVAPGVVLPLGVATRILQEVNSILDRRYVGADDRLLLQRRVRSATYPQAPPTGEA